MSIANAILPLLLLIGACKPPPNGRQHMPLADPVKGREIIARVGCGSCHAIPGVRWPKGQTGPSLAGFAERSLIAGRLPNRPDLLADFVRDAPASASGTAMPAMPISEEEAHHVAAYLYAIGDR